MNTEKSSTTQEEEKQLKWCIPLPLLTLYYTTKRKILQYYITILFFLLQKKKKKLAAASLLVLLRYTLRFSLTQTSTSRLRKQRSFKRFLKITSHISLAGTNNSTFFPRCTYHSIVSHFNAQVSVAVSVF